MFNGYLSKKKYPYPIRKIEVWNEGMKECSTPLTVHLTFVFTTIAAIDKDRCKEKASSRPSSRTSRSRPLSGPHPMRSRLRFGQH
jgi:hypothetical protein